MAERMPNPYLRPVLLAVAVAFAPHALHLPVWISLLCLCSWGYLLLARHQNWKLPGKRWRNILAVAATILLLLAHGGRPSLEAGVSVLAVLLALKPMELASRRDAMAALLMTSFLIVFNLFFAQDLAAAFMALAGVLALTAALVRVTHPASPPLGALRMAGKLLLQGAPLALVLFLVFPRLPGGLLGYQAPVTPSGFSETLAPGDVSNLVLNREVAFRVEFQEAPPPRSQRYWRGLVLWDFNGQRWMARNDIPPKRHSLVGSDPESYTISLEPHGKRWLFALDMPLAATAWATLRQDFTLRSRVTISRQRTYTLRSFLRYDTGPILRWERRLGLRLPVHGNSGARELAASWMRSASSQEEIVQRCMLFFRDAGFSYTLSPEEPGTDWIDGFLFTTKEGFCGHYAGAMAFLMRAAGVPARVVAGYLGAEENPLGEYYIVRQSHAHAWVEVWLDDQGWVRKDPTSMVAPQRLEEGLLAALAGQGAGALGGGSLPSWLRPLQMGWDAVNHFWGRTVLDYSWRSQRGLLRRLGLNLRDWGSRLQVALLALAALAAGIAGVFFLRRLQWRSPGSQDQAGRVWRKLCNRLARAGMPRPSWMGPMEYAELVAARRADLAEAMHAAAQYYACLRYAPPAVSGDIRELQRQARRVRKALKSRSI